MTRVSGSSMLMVWRSLAGSIWMSTRHLPGRPFGRIVGGGERPVGTTNEGRVASPSNTQPVTASTSTTGRNIRAVTSGTNTTRAKKPT